MNDNLDLSIKILQGIDFLREIEDVWNDLRNNWDDARPENDPDRFNETKKIRFGMKRINKYYSSTISFLIPAGCGELPGHFAVRRKVNR